MNDSEQQKLRATNHYLHYPDDEIIPTHLAYGFRSVFLLLVPYIILSMLLWGLIWSGKLNIGFINNLLTWHIYEMLFGLLTAGALAFLTTAIPELFPGTVPLVGRKLQLIVYLWLSGRISFWLMDYVGLFVVASLNLAMLAWLIWFARGIVFDRLQRHASLGYTLIITFFIELWFFLSQADLVQTSSLSILKIALGSIVILLLLILRRVNMEAINEVLEDQGIDDIYLLPPAKTNLAILTVFLFTLVEFIAPQNSALGWLGFATAAAILGITSSYALKDEFILNQPYVIYLALVYVLLALGYGLMGWDILFDGADETNHFRHLITSGGLGLSYLLVMVIISLVHTGRQLTANINTHLMVFLIIFATLMRSMIPFFREYTAELYFYSSIIWIIPFILYIKQFFPFLVKPRVDKVKG